ncbi:DUF523 domain-containing protein [bacterium]|nr:DUF523 domain-containing protein [FCB group bacterium]MBL7192309.1 DUF523 domain-containing protein [bacterium]
MLVSACLLGLRCRYDGKILGIDISEQYPGCCLIPVCPEQLGGLPTPREPSEIAGGDGGDVLQDRASVMGKETGTDYAENFIRGAYETLKAGGISGCRKAVLKADSPSCGYKRIYCKGKLIEGSGVTAALLAQNGFEIITI